MEFQKTQHKRKLKRRIVSARCSCIQIKILKMRSEYCGITTKRRFSGMSVRSTGSKQLGAPAQDAKAKFQLLQKVYGILGDEEKWVQRWGALGVIVCSYPPEAAPTGGTPGRAKRYAFMHAHTCIPHSHMPKPAHNYCARAVYPVVPRPCLSLSGARCTIKPGARMMTYWMPSLRTWCVCQGPAATHLHAQPEIRSMHLRHVIKAQLPHGQAYQGPTVEAQLWRLCGYRTPVHAAISLAPPRVAPFGYSGPLIHGVRSCVPGGLLPSHLRD